jgi:hypothetical protein
MFDWQRSVGVRLRFVRSQLKFVLNSRIDGTKYDHEWSMNTINFALTDSIRKLHFHGRPGLANRIERYKSRHGL